MPPVIETAGHTRASVPVQVPSSIINPISNIQRRSVKEHGSTQLLVCLLRHQDIRSLALCYRPLRKNNQIPEALLRVYIVVIGADNQIRPDNSLNQVLKSRAVTRDDNGIEGITL